MAHGHQEVGPVIAQTVLTAVGGLDASRLRLYVDLTLASLTEAARKALEELMKIGDYEYQSEFARTYVAQGIEKGRQEGLQEGELIALLEVLDARGLKVDDGSRKRILACTDLAQLKIWLRKAVKVHSVQELFEQGPITGSAAHKASKQGRGTKARGPRSKR